jgi:hypothetical protein
MAIFQRHKRTTHAQYFYLSEFKPQPKRLKMKWLNEVIIPVFFITMEIEDLLIGIHFKQLEKE